MNKRTGFLIVIGCCLVYHITLGMICYHFGYSSGASAVPAPRTVPVEAADKVNEPVAAQAPEPEPSPPKPREIYVIKESAGRIVIIHNGEIIDEKEMDITLLPKDAQARLKEGVEAHSLEELAELLEAYSI